MAQIDKPNLHFNTITYTGNGSTQSITGVGFQPDWVWGKQRSGTNSHELYDAVRGVNKILYSDLSDAEGTNSNGVSAFNTDGFTVAGNTSINLSGQSIVAWNWKAGTTGSGTSTGSGTGKAYSYSVNTTSGFSIVKYIGNGTAGHTIPHHLGIAPTYTIVKALGNTESWQVISSGMDADKFIQLNSSDAQMSQGSYNMFNSTRPNSTVVTLGNQNHTNQDGTNYIMYNFCDIKGFSKSGSYIGNGNADGTFVYTGFKPAFVIAKRSDTGGTANWIMWDNKRNLFNATNLVLKPNTNAVESTSTGNLIDFTSNGFKCRGTDSGSNSSGASYIYIAFAENPIVGSNNIPATAR